jgi:hypothetical protein
MQTVSETREQHRVLGQSRVPQNARRDHGSCHGVGGTTGTSGSGGRYCLRSPILNMRYLSTTNALSSFIWKTQCSLLSRSLNTIGDFKVGVSVGVYCTKCTLNTGVNTNFEIAPQS